MTDEPTELAWGEPKPLVAPARDDNRIDENPGMTKVQVLERLRDNPGRWVRLSNHATRNAAVQVKIRLRRRGFTDHEFRTQAENGRVVLFARWPGDE